MQKPWFQTLLVIGLVISSLVGIKAWQIKQAIDVADAIPEYSETVESAWLTPSSYTPLMKVVGKVLSPQQFQVVSELEGRIIKVGFTSGSPVKKGQLLIQQDTSEEKALYKAAQSRLQLAKTLLERNQRLLKKKAVSQEDLDRALVSVSDTEAEIAQLESMIRKKNIRAPFAGTAGVQHFHPGQVLNANAFITELIGNTYNRWIDFHLPAQTPILTTNEPIQFFINNRDQTFEAKIIARSKSLDRQNNSLHYRAVFNTQQARQLEHLHIGSSVQVAIKLTHDTQASHVWQVPSTSILYSHLGSYVFTLTPDAADEQRHDLMNQDTKHTTLQQFRAVESYVEVLSQTDTLAYITFIDGQQDSTLVAANGAFKLYPGVLTNTQMPIRDNQ